MEDSAAKDAAGKSASKLLRYPLRSATRSKEVKPPLADSTNSHTATKRGRVASNVTKSVSVLDLSGKDKSAKPPRRLSVPSKPNASPASKSFGTITPISEARSKRAASVKSDTPQSDVSKTSSNRKKFSVLASASYWLTQIKLSETAGKHSITLGFFKLALEAGCEPMQKITDELKSYVRKHDLNSLPGLEETVKELYEGYNISKNYEPSEASVTGYQIPSEPNQSSEDDIHSSSSSITDAEKLKPKSLDISSDEIQQVKQSKKEDLQKYESVKKTRRAVSRVSESSTPAPEVRGRSIQRKPSIPVKQESTKGTDKVKKQGKKSARGEVAEPVNSQPEEEVLQEDKENMAAPRMETAAASSVEV